MDEGVLDDPSVGVARYWLIRGGVARARADLPAARAALERATAASTHEGFRGAIGALVEELDRPWPEASGPLSRGR